MPLRATETGRVIAAAVVTVVLLGGVLAATGGLPAVQGSNASLPENLTIGGELNVIVSGDNTTATAAVPIGNTPPTIASAAATDGTDGDGIVRDGDTIDLSATVADAETGVANVTANASAFGVETLVLRDGNGDGTYTGTLTVDASAGAGEGAHAIRIAATDTANRTRRATTNTLQLTTLSSVSSCTVIDEPGYYELANDVTDSSAGACLNVTASNVVIDGQGHTLDGTGATDSVGIRLSGSEDARVTNVTIRDVVLTEWGNGINATHADDVSIADVTVSRMEATGITLAPVGGTLDLRRTTVRNGVTDREGADAVFVRGSAEDLAFTNLTVDDAGYEGLDVGFRSAFNIDLVDGDVTVRDASFSETGRTAVAIDIRGNLTVADTRFTSVGTDRYGGSAMEVTSLQSIALRDLSVRGGDTGEGEISASAFNENPFVDTTITVSNVSMDRVLTGGLFAAGEDRATVRDTTVTNGEGGVTADAQKGPAIVRNVTLHNVSEGITASASPVDGAVPEESSVLVANATVRELRQYGTGLELGGDDPAAPITVRDTTVSGGQDGADIESRNVTVTNLSVSDTTSFGIRVDSTGPLEDRRLAMTDVDVHNASNWGLSFDYFRSADLTRVNLTEIREDALLAYRSIGTLSDVRLSSARIDGTFRDVAIDNGTIPSGIPANWTDVGSVIETRDADVRPSNDPSYLNVTVQYDDSAVSDVDERTLSVWRHDGNWTQSGGVLDRDANTLTKNLTEFSTVAPLAVPSSLGLAPGNLSVTIDSTTSPVNETVPLVVEATVENTGDVQNTRTVTLSVNGTERDSRLVRLGPGESTAVSLRWQTVPGDAGTYDLTVASPDDAASRTLTVVEPDGPRPVRSCKVIEWPGSYVLAESIETSDAGPCIEITTSDVVFSGGGHAIDGGADGDGVVVGGEGNIGLNNVTIRDATLTDWRRGVNVQFVEDVRLDGVTVRNATDEGIRTVYGGGEIEFRRVTVANGSEDGPAVSVRSNAERVTAANLTVADAGTVGLNVEGLDPDPLRFRSNVPTSADVAVTDTTIRGTSSEGISVRAVRNVTAENTTVRNAGSTGAYLNSTSSAAELDGVSIDGTDYYGLIADAGTDVAATNVTVRDVRVDGIDLEADGSASVADALIDGAGGDGIVADARTGVDVATVTVRGVSEAGLGLGVASGNASIEDALIEDAGTGIRGQGSGRLNGTVTDTTVRNADTALSVPESSVVSVDGLTVAGGAVPPTPVSFVARTNASSRIGVLTPERPVEPPAGNRSVFRFVDVAVEPGATLEDLAIAYDDADAGNLDESSLRMWQHRDGWTALGGDVDTTANTVTLDRVADTDGRVTLAPLGTASGPEPDVTGIDVDPNQVDTYERMTATVTVDNPGGRQIEAVELTYDGRVTRRKVVRLESDTTTDVTFEETFYDPRVLSVSARGTPDAETVTVREAPDDDQPEWPSWHLPPENDNYDRGLEAPRPPLSVEWNASVPEGCCVPMKPVVVEDTIYAYTYETTFAMDAQTGEVLWENTDVEGTYQGGIAYDDGRVFLATHDRGLVALDAASGTVVWNRTDLDVDQRGPVVSNDTLYIGTWAETGANMLALNTSTGETKWSVAYANTFAGYFGTPTVVNGSVYVPLGNESLIAHDATTGAVEWKRSLGYVEETTPAVKDGIVYVASGGFAPHLHALDADTGDVLWNATAELGYTGLAVTEDTVFMATCGDSAFAYDAATGERRWTRSDVGCAYDVSEPVAAEGVVYLTNYDNETLAVDRDTGETLYTYTIPGSGKGTSPVPYKGRLYTASRYTTGEIYALGGPEWPRITPDTAAVNASTTLTVLGEYREEVVPNATVTVDGTRLETGADGMVEYTFDSAGRYEVRVTAENTTRRRYAEVTRTITVGDFAAVSVSVDATNSPVTAGDTLAVNATITNDGTREGTRNVTLEVGGARRDAVTVSLGPGESTTVSLSWATEEGDAGEYAATVSAGDDTDSIGVSVREPVDLPPSVEPIESCADITEPGRYALTSDVSGSGICIDVTADDVIIDGLGRAIEAENGSGTGIRVGYEQGAQNVTITDVTVRGWETGVDLRGVTESRVSDVRAVDTGVGIDVAAAEIPESLGGPPSPRRLIAPSADVTVRGNSVTGANASGISVDRSRDLTIRGNTVEDANGSGIVIVASEAITVADNTVSGNTGTGVAVVGRPLTTVERFSPTPRDVLPVPRNNTLVNNTATDNGGGISVFAAENNTVRNNTARDNEGDGISLSGGSLVSRGGNNTVVDNRLLANNGTGIVITGVLSTPADDNHVRNNTARANNGSGIVLLKSDGNELRGNHLVANDGSGLSVLPSSAGNEVRNNTAERNDRFGAMLAGSVDTALVDNTASENGESGFFLNGDARSIADNAATENGQDGFRILTAGETLDGNAATDNARHGFRIEAENVTLQGGTATANGADGVSIRSANATVAGIDATGNDHNGIQVRVGDATEIRDSVTNDNGRHGVLLNGSVADTRLSDSVARNNGAWAIAIREASGTVVDELDIGASTEPGTTLSFEGENVAVGSAASPPGNPDNESLGRYFEAESTGAGAFLDIELHYTDADASGIDESSLTIRRYDGSEWVAVDSTPDPAGNVVAANVTDFSTFGAFGTAGGEDGDDGGEDGDGDDSGDGSTIVPGQPGFGAVLAGIALLLVGLLARRRR